jgi:maltose/maltodextrin transport system substrate-binding protein
MIMKISMKIFAAGLALGMMCQTAAAQLPKLNMEQLRKQAEKEYLNPVSPGYEGKHPFWNVYSTKFIYAPAFDFKETEGAVEYLYTVSQGDKVWTFKDKKPFHALSPVWNKIPVGKTSLKVEALDKKGEVIAVVGERNFLRDFGFTGDYPAAARSYKESAIKGLLYIHYNPAIQNWKNQTVPDMGYLHNTYPCKSVSGTIRAEMLIAKLIPSLREEALAISRNAAEFLMNSSQPADAPLAYFPPTYYGNIFASAKNVGKTMSMEATKAANALLDLYDETGDKKYFEHVLNILRTYQKLQATDGSIPIKFIVETGEPDKEVCARLHPILGLTRRIHDQYGVTEFEGMRQAAQKWMETVAFKDFDMVPQFEDIRAKVPMYTGLTHWTCVPYATYRMTFCDVDEEELKTLKDFLDFGEDQFANWDCLPDEKGLKVWLTPGVIEQYKYKVLVDDSAANMASGWLAYYQKTGDKVALAKALAMVNQMTNVQSPESGLIPTVWKYRPARRDNPSDHWFSCLYITCNTLLRFAQLEDPKSVDFDLTFWF